MELSRRQILPLPLAALAAGQPSSGRALKIVCAGGHPDDPESGCGGSLARYAELGHRVTIIYLTRGEAGIPRKSHEEAAAIRSAECAAACKILGAKQVFAVCLRSTGFWCGSQEFKTSFTDESLRLDEKIIFSEV